MKTLLLNPTSWDLMLDISNNIAVASDPYSLAQDAASAIKTFLGEVFYDTTIGVPWDNFLGRPPNLSLLKAKLIAAALTVPFVASAKVFITSMSDRNISGQVQITSVTGQVSVSNF